MVNYEGKNWLRVLFRLHGSVLPSLLPRILVAAAIGVAARYLYGLRHFHLPNATHALLGVALGLLLVFRTNASYDRWWEGRRLLGAIVNRSRDFLRQAGVYITDADTRRELERLVVLWYALLVLHLRGERDLNALGALVTEADKKVLEPVTSRPGMVLHQITALLADRAAAGQLSEPRLQLMDANLTALIDAWGGCDRIVRTPIPFAYAQHIKAFLALFVLTVPFAIVDAMGAVTPLAAAIVAYAMFGIEEIGVEIEDPFGTDPNDLPMERIAEVLKGDAKMLVGGS